MLQVMFPDCIDNLKKDKGYFQGSPPFIVPTAQDVRELLIGSSEEKSQIEFGAHQVIIVRSEEAKKNLPAALQRAIKLTVFQAKGLEFDDVFLYDFFADSPADADEWRTIVWYMEQKHKGRDSSSPSKLEEYATRCFGSPRRVRDFESRRSQYCKIMEELKQLYTAFTRARVSLFMFDSNEEKSRPMYHALVSLGLAKRLDMNDVNEQLNGDQLDLDQGERAQVARIRAKSSTPEEYRKAGKQLYDMGLFDAAIHPFSQSGDKSFEHAARGRAILVEFQRDYDKAISSGMPVKTAIESLAGPIEEAGYQLLQSQLPECLEQAMTCFYQLPHCLEYSIGIAAKLGGRHLLTAATRCYNAGDFDRAAELYLISKWVIG
jgi:ATP-dependent exoDNAse (exonuclease V) beta subunit